VFLSTSATCAPHAQMENEKVFRARSGSHWLPAQAVKTGAKKRHLVIQRKDALLFSGFCGIRCAYLHDTAFLTA
jgi:hypothetical protein